MREREREREREKKKKRKRERDFLGGQGRSLDRERREKIESFSENKLELLRTGSSEYRASIRRENEDEERAGE